MAGEWGRRGGEMVESDGEEGAERDSLKCVGGMEWGRLWKLLVIRGQ